MFIMTFWFYRKEGKLRVCVCVCVRVRACEGHVCLSQDIELVTPVLFIVTCSLGGYRVLESSSIMPEMSRQFYCLLFMTPSETLGHL